MTTLLRPFKVALVLPALLLAAFLFFLFFAEVTEQSAASNLTTEGIAVLSSIFLTASLLLTGLYRPRLAGYALCTLMIPMFPLFRFYWFFDLLFATIFTLGVFFIRTPTNAAAHPSK